MKKIVLLIALLVSICAKSQGFFYNRVVIPNVVDTTSGGGEEEGIVPPSFIQKVETAWDNTIDDKVTSSFSVQTGDILVAFGVCEDHGSELSVSGGSLTWTERQQVNATNYTRVFMWTAVATSNATIAVTFSRGSSRNFGGSVLTFRGSSGIGVSGKANNTGGPSLDLTTTSENSVIVCAVGDWAAQNGTTRVWRTVNSITPTSGSGETTYFRNSSIMSVYIGYYSNTGATGSKTVGLSIPGSQSYSIVGIELKGQ